MPVRIVVNAQQALDLADAISSDRSFYVTASRRAGQRIADALKRRMEDTVKGWSSSPTVRVEMEYPRGGGFTGRVYIDDKIYYIVNWGARRHYITPRRAPILSFNWAGPGSYVPSTKPGSLKSGTRRKVGSRVSFMRVNHPGSKGRRFDKQLVQRFERIAPVIVTGEILKEARRRGYITR